MNVPWGTKRNLATKVNFVNEIIPFSIYGWFSGFKNLTTLINLNNLNTKYCDNFGCVFEDCKKIKKLDLSILDTSSMTSCDYLIGEGCELLEEVNLSGWDFSKVGYISIEFPDSVKKINLSNCIACSSFNEIVYPNEVETIDFTGFDSSRMTSMRNMFYSCYEITTLDLRSFDTSNINNFQRAFFCCEKLEQILVGEKWAIDEGANTTQMFLNCKCSDVTHM